MVPHLRRSSSSSNSSISNKDNDCIGRRRCRGRIVGKKRKRDEDFDDAVCGGGSLVAERRVVVGAATVVLSDGDIIGDSSINDGRWHRRTSASSTPSPPFRIQQRRRRRTQSRPLLGGTLLLSFLLLCFLTTMTASAEEAAIAVVGAAAAEQQGHQHNSVYRYNVCNGLSNQLLYHAASIAIAIEQSKLVVEIPDHFIVNGVQHTDDSVLPSASNSIPFGLAFDAPYFLQAVQQLGGRSSQPSSGGGGGSNIEARFVSFDFSKRQIPCAGMQSLHQADAELVRQILQAFRPSKQIQTLISGISANLEQRNSRNSRGSQNSHDENGAVVGGASGSSSSASASEGVCVHHRDGQDWYDHCARWGSINDGIYRGNCLGVPGRSFLESLEDRGLSKERSWVYYCGDHELPRALRSSPYDVVSRNDLMEPADLDAVAALFYNYQNQDEQQQQQHEGGLQQQPPIQGGAVASPIGNGINLLQQHSGNLRDLWALIDFYVCSNLELFIGNSVSTFSAIQIALRRGEDAFWYNSQSIPLGDIWRVYQVPIVYTYTELSMESGKYMLQASIASVRKHMPHNKIHILYHGTEDKAFRLWLAKRNVKVHQHDPAWRQQIEKMRMNGDPAASHLFLHSGNYFGTWQRIDIPKYVNSEYALLLDADTLVMKPFTLADFGLDLTYAIAMSAEFHPNNIPLNAGVTLMNVPRMRQTYDDFLQFILQHVHSAKFDHPAPSDQGAYLEFYDNQVRFLDRNFNFKPYWQQSAIGNQDPFVVHFHGAKPHDYMRQILGDPCDKATQFLCDQAMELPFLCRAIQQFAQYSRSVGNQVSYCNASFKGDKAQAFFCTEILLMLSSTHPQQNECYDFPTLVRKAVQRVPAELGLPVGKIEKNLRKRSKGSNPGVLSPLLLAWSVAIFLVLLVFRVKSRRHTKGRHSR